MTQATNLAALGSYITASSTGQIIVNNAGSLGLYDSTVPGIYFQRPVTTSEVNVPYIRAQANGTTTTDLALGASSSSGKILFYTAGTNVGSFDPNGSFNILSSTNFGSLTPNALNGNLSIGGIGPAHTISFGTSNSGATGWVERLRLYNNAAQGSAGITSYETITFGTPNAGITFDNSSASVNSTLNDYETGTWSPTFNNFNVTTGWSFGAARYTKIGRIVYISVSIVPGSATLISTANSSYIGGLPFYVGGGINSPCAFATNYIDTLGTGAIYGTTGIYTPTMSVNTAKTIFVTGVYEATF